MKTPILLCAHPWPGQPENALAATCDTCSTAVIYDPLGFETVVKSTGQQPKKVCLDCFLIMAGEENITMGGFTVGDKIAPFTLAGAEAARQWRLKHGGKE